MEFCCSGWFRGRAVGGRGVVVVARLLVGEYGDHVLVEEVLKGHRLQVLLLALRAATDHAAPMNAAIYPNAVTAAAAILNRTRADEQDPLAKLMNTRPTSDRNRIGSPLSEGAGW
jgi:hypothetical protein